MNLINTPSQNCKMFLSAYSRFIVRRSYLFLTTVSVVSSIFTVIPLIFHEMPSFSDPISGFETRGTTLAKRFIAWENLIEETRPSKSLAVNPKDIEDQIRMNSTYYNKTAKDKLRSGQGRSKHKGKNKKKKPDNSTIPKSSNDSLETVSSQHVHWGYGKNVSYEDEKAVHLKDHTRTRWITIKSLQRPDIPLHHNYASGKCGSPSVNYAHLVVTTSDNTSLLLYENIQKQCEMQSWLVGLGAKEYHNLCETLNNEDICCPVWSVPNYIALLSGKNSCENLTIDDVTKAKTLLEQCAGYFHNFSLMASCDLDRCNVPVYCSQYNAVFNMLFYLIDSESFSPPTLSNSFVKHTMLFFPIARSSTIMSFYNKLQNSDLSFGNVIIPAIDFGLKNALFDLWIIQDTWLVGLGGVFVFLGVWIYTKSLALSLLLFIAITYSLGISYFLYVYVFNLVFFPFMNLLVIVIVIGIGSDDAFLYVKVWKMIGKQLLKDNVLCQTNPLSDIKNISSAGETIIAQILEETIKHSALTILITTLTTAVAFFASYVSYIPAINCFSIFAGTAVLVNFFLMVTFLPTAVYIVDVKFCQTKIVILESIYKYIHMLWQEIGVLSNRFVVICISKLHIMFVLVLGAGGIYSIIVVFYIPGLRLPDSREFQLFQSNHPFEQYDMLYRDKFLFERFSKDIGTGSKMPLRWVWGIKDIDNGNHMDPASSGHLVFSETFNMSQPESQLWLLNFCAKLKSQPFFQQTLGPLLPNCFIESFKMYMNRRCVDTIDKIDRKPCCEVSKFPYEEKVFDFCIIKAIESLYQTPRELFMPGVAGPKFLKSLTPPKVAAIVVEFESVVPYSMSYLEMDKFFTYVENWTRHELKSAPPGMQGGWFLSDFQFYDLQNTLANGTLMALIVSAVLGFTILLPATCSFVTSVCALSAMIFSSTVTIAILVLSNWKLNVLESVAISTSAGLAVDFSLHYALSYTNAGGLKAARVKNALVASAGPTAAAALTTGFAGIFLLRSNLLPYSQIGTFLALIMFVSWIYATFFLCSLLHIVGDDLKKEVSSEEIKSVSRVSSVCSGVPNLESHELEDLADSNRTNLSQSHSPSSASATTVVLHDDSDCTCKAEPSSNVLLSDFD